MDEMWIFENVITVQVGLAWFSDDVWQFFFHKMHFLCIQRELYSLMYYILLYSRRLVSSSSLLSHLGRKGVTPRVVVMDVRACSKQLAALIWTHICSVLWGVYWYIMTFYDISVLLLSSPSYPAGFQLQGPPKNQVLPKREFFLAPDGFGFLKCLEMTIFFKNRCYVNKQDWIESISHRWLNGWNSFWPRETERWSSIFTKCSICSSYWIWYQQTHKHTWTKGKSDRTNVQCVCVCERLMFSIKVTSWRASFQEQPFVW